MAPTRERSIRPVRPAEARHWLALRSALWPDCEASDNATTIERFVAGTAREPLAAFLAWDAGRRPLGFIELSMRAYAEGCSTDRVAYVEGWYVVPAARRSGIGRALVQQAETWAHARDCTELASDTELANTASARAHRALGFSETGRIRCFRKALPARRSQISPPSPSSSHF